MSELTRRYEKGLKKLINNFFNADLNGEIIDSSSPDFKFSDFRKILLLRHDRIGDILISVPFIKKLNEILPDAEIDILLSYKNYSAKSANADYTNRSFLLSNNIFKSLFLIHQLKRNKYDLIIDLLDNESLNSNIVLKMLHPRIRLGFNKSNRFNYNYVVEIPDKTTVHPAIRLMNLLIPFGLGYKVQDLKLEYRLTDKEKEKAKVLLPTNKGKLRLGINLSGSSEDKYWGVDNFINFINTFLDKYINFDITIFSSPGYREDAELIQKKSNVSIAPSTKSFNIYAAMLAECNMILTPDTSAVHLASAFGIPVVALYQHSDKLGDQPWYPLNVKYRAVINEQRIRNIKVTDVLVAMEDLMKESGF